MDRPDQRFFFTFKGRRPIGMWWLNGFAPKSCWLHYCFFREAWGRDTIRTGRVVTDYLLDYPDLNGEFYFDVIKGQTPANNPLALRVLKLTGFQVVGNMPCGAWERGRRPQHARDHLLQNQSNGQAGGKRSFGGKREKEEGTILPGGSVKEC